MWETIRDVLTSPNATVVCCFLILVIVAAFLLFKSGMIQIRTDAIQIGAADRERNIIRQQLNFAKLHLTEFEVSLKKPDDYNCYIGKYIVEVVYDIYVEWITFNHISKSDAYIKVKQKQVVAAVMGLVEKDEFKTEEFKELLRNDTKESILSLIEIREVYK